ncbi:ABC transporter, transmembrane domain, type 1 [Cordyceps javanica]|nr:ABC transporter, transmembrane domain, type 1 [Cordyceps javanica]
MSLVIYGASSPINYKATGIDIFKDCFLVVIDVGIISAGAKYMAFAVPFLFLILFLLQKYYLRTSRQLRFMDLEAKSPLYTHFTETARGLLHIRGLRREANFTARLHTLLNNSQKPNYYLIAVQQWLTAAMDCIGMLLGISLVALASKFGDSSPSGTGLALLNLITFSEQLTFFMNDWTGLETSLGAIARLDSFVKHTPVEKDAADAATPPPTWPEDGTIEFRGVDVGYGGKTTMLLTLLNMLEHDGPLLIDGIDITHVPRQVLRTRITTISQDFFEVPGSLRDNLLPPESTRPTSADQRLDDEAVQNILFVAGLSDVVRDRGGGLNAPFDELGFSRGEMQLVALARAIIHTLECRTRIVLLDEATGVLDSDTRATIQTAMSRYFANHTVIIISHQKDAVKTVDKVYDMNTNRVFH